MNKVFLIGNLTRDPELTQTANGISVCKFSLAVGRSYINGDGERETDFFSCTAWRGLADNIARYCKKGNKVAVSGSIQMRTYEGNDGVRRTAVDVIVQECEFLMQRREDDGNMAQANSGRQAPREPVRQSFDDDDRIGMQVNPSRKAARKPVLQSFDDDGDIPF